MKKSKWIVGIVLCGIIALAPLGMTGDDDSGLVLRLTFTDAFGVVAPDSSGLGNDGQLMGQAYFQSDPVMGAAAYLYGPSGQINVPYSPSLEPPIGTVQVWVNVANRQDASIVLKTTDLMVNRQSPGGRAVYDIHMDSRGKVIGCIADDGRFSMWTCVSSKAMVVIPGTWQLFSLRWDGSTVALFVNGTLQAADTYTPIANIGLSYHGTSPLYIGVLAYWGSEYGEFIGQVSDLELYNRALAESEISAAYAARKGAITPSKPGKSGASGH
jgi:hypothetical protein